MGARMRAGRCVSSITLAMVKVLPEPVTPSSTWVRSAELTPSTRSRIAVGWSPAGSKSDSILMTMPPSDFSGRAGRCGVQIWPFLCSGLPDSISLDSASTVAVTPDCGIASASSRLMSRPGTGLRPAAARSRAVAAPPIDVPRAVLVGVDERSGIFFEGLAGLSSPPARRVACSDPGARVGWTSSASRAIWSAQSEIEPASGVPVNSACADSSKPPECNGSDASR